LSDRAVMAVAWFESRLALANAKESPDIWRRDGKINRQAQRDGKSRVAS